MLAIAFTNTEKKRVVLNPKTSTGAVATVDGVPTWTVTAGKCTLDVAADGLSAFIVSADDDAGVSSITILADADLGAGVEDISDIVEATVTGAKAANLGLSAEPAVPKTEVVVPAGAAARGPTRR